MLRTIFILLICLFRILFFLLLCLINSFFGTFEKTQLQIERFLEHLAKWHCFCRGQALDVFSLGIRPVIRRLLLNLLLFL